MLGRRVWGGEGDEACSWEGCGGRDAMVAVEGRLVRTEKRFCSGSLSRYRRGEEELDCHVAVVGK